MRGGAPANLRRGLVAGGSLLGLVGLLLAGVDVPFPAAAGAEGIRLSGEGRFRLRDISSTGERPVGIYGEPLRAGRSFRHRMLLELEAAVAPDLTAGALLRLSDEGTPVFAVGPERLADERGSAFLRYQTAYLRAVMGYYRIHLSPLLLMRWDAEDNPEGGGQSPCACGGVGGAVTSESLEEMQPDLMLEGLRVDADLGRRCEMTGFVARPRTAVEGESYRQWSYGGTLRFMAYHRPSTSFRSLSLAVLLHEDEKESVDHPPFYQPRRNELLGMELTMPVGRAALFRAEGVLTRTDEDLLAGGGRLRRGHGLVAEVRIRPRSALRGQAAYLRMSPHYFSLYQAVSYLSNRQGFRLSAHWEVREDGSSVWVFYKRLRELEAVVGGERRASSTLSIGGESVWGKVCRFRGILIREDDLTNRRDSVIGELVRDLSRRAEATFRYQYIDYRDEFDPRQDHGTHMSSILASVAF